MRVIHVLRKPLTERTVAANTLKHGTGGLNIDASRIAAPGEPISNHSRGDESAVSKGIYGDSKGQETHQTEGQKLGRWPANLILEHDEKCGKVCAPGCPVASLDEQTGAVRSAGHYPTTYSQSGGFTNGDIGKGTQGPLYNDTGGASRFYKQFGGTTPRPEE
jgi:site-specific DNA-methyltransferase (adenine-specific)